MRTLVLASVRRHGRRYVATAVAIVIAVGFMVAVNAVSAAARDGAAELAGQQLQGVDLVVEYPGEPDRILAAMQADPDVVRPEVVKSGYVPIGTSSGPSSVAVDTVDSDPSRVWQRVETGRLPQSPDEVVVDAGRLDELGLTLGANLRLGEGQNARELTVVGTVESTGGSRSGALYVTSQTADLLGDAMYPSFVLASVRDGASPDEVANRLTGELDGPTVRSASALVEDWRLSATDGIDVFQQLLLGFAAVALFVGAIVIANTFAIVLAQRERDVALLRCVGATRRQIVRSVTAEAFAVGLVSALAGVVAGWLAALGLIAAAGRWLPTAPMADPSLTLLAVVLPVVVAVVVTVAASWAPARRVARIAPVAALQPHQPAVATSRAGLVRTAGGVLLAGLGGLALVGSTSGNVMLGLVGGMVSFVGVLLLLPLIVPVALRVLGVLVARAGVAPRLAVANTGRNPRRTATTTSALLVGVTLVGTVLVGIATARQAVATELDETKPVDVMVMSDTGLPGSTRDELAQIDGVRSSVALDGADGTVGDVPITVLGIDEDAAETVRRDPAVPAAGEVWVPWRDDLMAQVEDGQPVRVTVDGRSDELTVRYVDGIGSSALVSAQTLSSLTSTADERAVWLRAEDGANPASVIDAVVSVTGDGFEVDGGLPDRAEALKQVDILLAIVLSLLGVAVVIAVVGVGNTLGLSVLERARENALLRALGLPARGLRLTLGIESVLMAVASAVLGGALGVLYGWFGVKALGAQVFVTEPQVVVPIGQLSILLAAAVLAGLLASVLPARRAARVKPAEGLATV